MCAAGYQQVRPFGHPVPGVSGAVVFARQDDEGNAVSLIAISCLEDIQLTGKRADGMMAAAVTLLNTLTGVKPPRGSLPLKRSSLTVWPEGMCNVLGPGLPMNRFWSLMLANVPLVITASFPLRAPYELNSRGVRLR